MRYGSVCSGIEAASVAWEPLGFSPVWFAEIAKFPSAVLAHRFPEVPNHGSLVSLADRLVGDARRIDLLVGGTPCQSFSVAGLRGGLSDERGNLALEFMRLAQALRPRWVVWENVPGVLSSNGGRDFGSILGALAELGYGFAWRVLDAQFFGVPQRRRRVFLVGYLGDWRPAAAVLSERTSLRRDTPTRRAAREDVAGTASRGAARSSWEIRGGAAREVAVAPCLDLGAGDGPRRFLTRSNIAKGVNNQTPLLAFDPTQITHPENRSSARGDTAGALAKSARPPHVAYSVALRGREGGSTAEIGGDQANALRAANGGGSAPYVLTGRPIVPGGAFTREAVEHLFDDDGRRVPHRGPPISVEHAGRIIDANTIAFNARQDPVHSTDTVGAIDTHPSSGSQAVCVTGGRTHALTSVGADASEDGTGRGTPITSAPPSWRVRRLTPRECERLQGFPDDYTLIPGAADGPRYAALGNSMAVPVMRWIGERIARVNALLSSLQEAA